MFVCASWSQCVVNCPFQDRIEAPQELLLLFSYHSVSRFFINFSEGFRLHVSLQKHIGFFFIAIEPSTEKPKDATFFPEVQKFLKTCG